MKNSYVTDAVRIASRGKLECVVLTPHVIVTHLHLSQRMTRPKTSPSQHDTKDRGYAGSTDAFVENRASAAACDVRAEQRQQTITVMQRPRKTVTDQLRDAMKRAEARGVTRYRMSKDANVSPSTVTAVIEGTTKPSLDIAERLAEAIGKRITLGDA